MIDKQIDDLPDLSEEIINDSDGRMIFPEYQMLFDELGEAFTTSINREKKAWELRKKTSSKEFGTYLKTHEIKPNLPEGMCLFSNTQFDELIETLSKLKPESDNYADKKNMKMVVYDYLCRDNTCGINQFSYEDLINCLDAPGTPKGRAASILKNTYSNDVRSWSEILKFCGIEETVKTMKNGDEWLFNEEDAIFVSELLSMYRDDTWKSIKSGLKKGKTTLEIYWNNGDDVWYSINKLVEGFREFLERNFNNDKEIVSVLYKKLRYIELMVFHKWAVYIGAKISKGKKWKFRYSDHNIEDLKELIKEMENKISELESEN